MKDKQSGFFWPSYTDLMTSLFFVMLVLYVLTFLRLKTTINLQKEKLAIIEAVENNLRPLKNDSTFFQYEEKYKRFKLAFEVKFKENEFEIKPNKLENYSSTEPKIQQAGLKLSGIVNALSASKETNPKLKEVSYILIISGSASKTGDEKYNYQLSYLRALSLWNYWRQIGIDFEAAKYKGLIDLQITGNGWGGLGRVIGDETKNQRFIIQILPKIGDIKVNEK